MTFSTLKAIARQVALGLGAAVTVFYTAEHMRPVFLGQEPVVAQLMQEPRAEEAARAAREAAESGNTPAEDSVMRTPRFAEDRRKFAEDLLRTGKLDDDRAQQLATFAVREAYLRNIPPALVFGVLLTENDEFKSTARSNVGAVGLMQISPKVWTRSLGKLFGTNLRDDETNIQYGVFILGSLLHERSKSGADYAVRTGLLRYNGCVRGRNTRNCHRYPDVVKQRIEQFAISQCGDAGYSACVTRPFKVAVARKAAAKRVALLNAAGE